MAAAHPPSGPGDDVGAAAPSRVDLRFALPAAPVLGWGAILLVFAAIELPAFERANATVAPIDPAPPVPLQSSIAFFARYVAMAFSSDGVSAMHEPGAVPGGRDR